MANALLSKTDVSLDPPFLSMLDNMQGYILKHHGRTHAYHLFFTLDKTKIAAAKKWITHFVNHHAQSAAKQLKDAKAHHQPAESGKAFDAGVFFNLSFSNAGLNALGADPSLIATPDPSFANGMKKSNATLADDPTVWEEAFQGEIHGLLVIADSTSSTVADTLEKMLLEVKPFCSATHIQKGKILRNAFGVGLEHFGYADGISQPNFLQNNDAPAVQWEDNHAMLNTVLVEEDKTKVGADCFGSYMVFRKLDQNVKDFLHNEDDVLPEVLNVHGDKNPDLKGAMKVGRFEDGSEVVNHSIAKGITGNDQLFNDFDYRDDTSGTKCPYHAHVRITNPRKDPIDPVVDQAFTKSVRLTRRAIPYNDIGRDEFDLDGDRPTHGVGLLFICYQSSIVKQFEFIQSRWANQGTIASHMVGQDGTIGQGPVPPGFTQGLPKQWGVPPNDSQPIHFGHFVTMKGGEYFYTPSIPFLKLIAL